MDGKRKIVRIARGAGTGGGGGGEQVQSVEESEV